MRVNHGYDCGGALAHLARPPTTSTGARSIGSFFEMLDELAFCALAVAITPVPTAAILIVIEGLIGGVFAAITLIVRKVFLFEELGRHLGDAPAQLNRNDVTPGGPPLILGAGHSID